ncbi:unnamed protein product [Miscanthus lutarioriparius]|uniref:Uncharacterized protein n=1 Tax=Miscanthus lutarioriparius TaxID=422564 RepID=A0A811SQL6_9POAL|nr:unnamed protein product [Miscanthus lutarioriparius]CAD6343614.1 unnamed protein product [Miscanthus lutarioriparius]
MGNCSCLERVRVMAWDDVDDDWGLSAERFAGRAAPARGVASAENGGGTRVKIRMTKGQLRRLLESAGRRGAPDEDVVAEIMSMGTVHVDVVADFRHAAESERHRRPPKPKLETIQEDDLDE